MDAKPTKGMRWPGKGMSWKDFFGSLWKEYNQDNLGDVAGNLTYAGLMSLFPFLIFLMGLAGLLITPEIAQQAVSQASKVAPGAVTQILSERLKSLQESSGAGVLTFGALLAFWSATNGVTALMRALNTVYGVPEGRPFWKVRLIAIGATLFTAVLALLAAVIAVGTPAIAQHLPEPLNTVLPWLRLPIAAALMTFLWAVLFYFMPDVEQEFRFITPGSVIGVGIWLVASYGFSLYVDRFGSFDATYGALGGVVILLLWMWISSQVLLVGAEINAILEHKSPAGKRAGAKSMAERGVDDNKTDKAERQVGTDSPAKVRWASRNIGQVDRRANGRAGRAPAGLDTPEGRVWWAAAAVSALVGRKTRS